TLPLELSFSAVAAQGPVAMGRSRSDQLPKRSSSSRRLQQSPHQSGVVGTRFPRPPSGGFAYSTDEDSASMESRMILNYVESPLKKTPEFWEAPRPVLDRLNRRRERGLLPAGYGTGLLTGSSSGAINVEPRRTRASTADPGSLYGGSGGADGYDSGMQAAPRPLRAGSAAAAAAARGGGVRRDRKSPPPRPLRLREELRAPGLRRVDSAPHLNRRAPSLDGICEGVAGPPEGFPTAGGDVV
ncbi:unnamed protein product, partial [Ectocarpus sp. 12 AP-2014]